MDRAAAIATASMMPGVVLFVVLCSTGQFMNYPNHNDCLRRHLWLDPKMETCLLASSLAGRDQGLYSFSNVSFGTKNLNPIDLACLSGVPPGQTGRPDRLATLKQYWVLDGFSYLTPLK
ncbi:MAG: hypothetical protein KDC54_16415 [Lewinella sp.]|nr:hypothetical protein [Lewinella sp.]